jgi:septum formation protein
VALVAGRAQPSLQLVLASTSPYRRALLERLGLPFTLVEPMFDETPHPGESPEQLVRRLAAGKAHAVAERFEHALIIGADQVGVCAGRVLNKPGSRANAAAQLTSLSGKRVTFLTGLSVLNTSTGRHQLTVESYHVHLRELAPATVERYLDREQPYDCAGAFKAEGLGVALFRAMDGRDPTCLIGLPLIALVDCLLAEGLDPLG